MASNCHSIPASYIFFFWYSKQCHEIRHHSFLKQAGNVMAIIVQKTDFDSMGFDSKQFVNLNFSKQLY
jgi:hypothetical protein